MGEGTVSGDINYDGNGDIPTVNYTVVTSVGDTVVMEVTPDLGEGQLRADAAELRMTYQRAFDGGCWQAAVVSAAGLIRLGGSALSLYSRFNPGMTALRRVVTVARAAVTAGGPVGMAILEPPSIASAVFREAVRNTSITGAINDLTGVVSGAAVTAVGLYNLYQCIFPN